MRKIQLLVFAMITLMAVSCKEEVKTFTYENPNANLEFRDTHILPDNGKYYAIGTSAPFWGGANPGVKIYSSDDLMNWKFEKLLIDAEALADTVWYKDRFWAPELHKFNNKYYLTFNCQNNSGGYGDVDNMKHYHACGIAVADSILGPYTVMTPNEPITPFASNDMTLFQDDDGKIYTFFNNGWTNVHKMYVAELDTVNFKLMEEPVVLISQDTTQYTWDAAGVEGCNVIKNNGTYYMFYSSWTNGYAVGVATATNIRGPWTKCEDNPLFGAFMRNDSTFVIRRGVVSYEPESPIRNIGHNSVFVGPDGRFWTSCHADPVEGKLPQTVIDPFWFEDGKLVTSCPTFGPQTVTYKVKK